MKNPSFTEQIRRLIEESGETRYRISLDCGIDQGLLSRFMAGKSTFSMPTLDRLAEYLDWQIIATPKNPRPTKARKSAE